MSSRFLAVVLLLLGCASEREEIHGRAPVEPSSGTEQVAPSPAVANIRSITVTAEEPPADSADATESISAAALAREAAGRASAARQRAEVSSRDAQRALASALDAIRRPSSASIASAAADDARASAAASAQAAIEATDAAAEAQAGAAAALSAAPRTPEGQRAARQAAHAASAADSAASAARTAAERASAAAQNAESAAAVAAALARATETVNEALSERSTITEAAEAATASATAAAEEADRASVASDEGRERDLATASSAARTRADSAAAAAAALEGHEAMNRARRATLADGVTASLTSEGGVAKEEALEGLEVLIQQLDAHHEWLAARAAEARAHATEADRAADGAESLQARTESAVSPLDLPEVPAAPAEEPAAQRPTGIVSPSRAPSRSVPDHGRWRQVEGGSEPDWLPGGYAESTLVMRADGVLEVRRTFADDMVLTWRLSYRWSGDRTSIVLGAEEGARPPPGSLLGFSGGPTAATEPLPISVRCQPLRDGRLRIGSKIYELVP